MGTAWHRTAAPVDMVDDFGRDFDTQPTRVYRLVRAGLRNYRRVPRLRLALAIAWDRWAIYCGQLFELAPPWVWCVTVLLTGVGLTMAAIGLTIAIAWGR